MIHTFPVVRMDISNESVEFGESDIIEAEVVREVHPIGIELPASTARLRVYLQGAMRDKFNPFSNGTYYQSLVTGLIVKIYENVNGEEVYIGRFYLEEWRNPQENEIEFVCSDAIGVIGQQQFDGKFYETATPVSTIIGDLLNPIAIGFTVDAVVAAKTLKGYLPGNKTIRESLQQVLFATGAYASCEASDVIKIMDGVIPIAGAVYPGFYYDDASTVYDTAKYSDQIVEAPIIDLEKTDKQNLNLLQQVTAVEIISHDYSQGATEEEIFSGALEPGDYKVVYPKPYWQVTAAGVGDRVVYLALADGITLLVGANSGTYPDVTILTLYGEFEFQTNSVFLHVPEPGGSVLIKGKPWIDSTQSFLYVNPDGVKNYESGVQYDAPDARYDISIYQRNWSVYAPPNIWKIDQATLVQAALAPSVLAKVVEYARLRYQQNITLFPRLDNETGEVKIVDSLYGKDIVGVIERMVSNLTGGYLMDTEVVGLERIVA